MTLNIALLVLLSAALHPIWNALIKRDARPEGAFIGLIVMLIVISGSHALIAGYDLFSVRRVWTMLILSCIGQILYGYTLIATLKRGDLSAYYPIIRSSPLFIVIVGFFLLGETYSWPLLTGVACVLMGAFLLQYRRGLRLLDDPKTLMLSVLAMSGVGVYSIADAKIMQEIEPPVLFFWVETLCLPSYILIYRFFGHSPLGMAALFAWTRQPAKFFGIGAICYLSYILILMAYAQGGDVAAVTSVRQASIPISVLIGGLWLKELGMAQRL
ncbi:MAG: DMT family transporter, partial [Rhodospirillales bacterium]|nr:DMT family transporter [Rhodospirillales bacterium]